MENEGRYGYRRILAVLREENVKINHKTVQKLMKGMNLQGKQRQSKYRSYKGEVGLVAPNLLNRDFKTTQPYEKLVTDVTEFAVCDEKIYLSPIMDLYNKEILSYSVSRSPNFAQTREMLTNLFERLPKDAAPLAPFGPRLAIPNEGRPADAERAQRNTKYVPKRELLRQQLYGKLLREIKSGDVLRRKVRKR